MFSEVFIWIKKQTDKEIFKKSFSFRSYLNQIAKYLNESEQNLTKELLNNYQEELQLLDKKLKKMLKEIQGG